MSEFMPLHGVMASNLLGMARLVEAVVGLSCVLETATLKSASVGLASDTCETVKCFGSQTQSILRGEWVDQEVPKVGCSH